ncbi:MAG: tetratricopeptide repeat protein [Patescibacteria group bacterium]
MKTPAVQIGIISLSAALLITVVLLSFGVARQFMSANLLSETLTEDDSELSLTYETRITKGDQLFEAGYYSLAASEYSIAVTLEENVESAYTKLGKSYLKLGSYTEALASLKRAYELNPNDDARVNYAIALLRNKKFDEAETLLNGGNGEHQATAFYQSLLLAYQGKTDEAQAKLEKAISLSGSVPTTYLQNFQSAFQNYKAQQGGQTIYLQALLTKALIDAEEYPLAEELSLKVLNTKNDYRDVWVLLGYSQLQLEKFTEAEDAFKQAKKLDAVKPETHYFLGVAHYEQAEYAEAVDSFELALLYDFTPENEAYLKLAESQAKLGNFEDALAAYEYLIKIDKQSLTLFAEPLHIATDLLSDLDRALTLAEESTSYFPEEAQSHTYLAEIYLKRGELEKAASSIEIAFDIDPDLAEAHYIAGQIRLAQANPEGAKWEFKKAYELSKPGNELSVKAAEQYNALILTGQAP